MDLTGLEGRTFGPHLLPIRPEAVADFVDVTGGDKDRWTAAAPPSYIAAALFAVAPDLLGQLADRSVIHGEQTFTWQQPLRMDTTLSVHGTVGRVRERAGVAFVGFELEAATDSQTVATGTSLFLVSGDQTATDLEEREEPAVDDQGNPIGGELGMSRADLVRYAAATRDWNPIHWDHATAVAAGLPGVVVHGLAQAAWALAASSAMREGDRPLASARIRFRNPLLPATSVNVAASEENGVVTCSVSDALNEYLSARIVLAEE